MSLSRENLPIDLRHKKNAIQQIGKKYTRQQAFRSAEPQEEKDADKAGRLSERYIISRTKNAPLNLLSFVQTNGDPAKKVWSYSFPLFSDSGLKYIGFYSKTSRPPFRPNSWA